MSVVGFYTDNGKKKPITARKTRRPRRRPPALIRAEELATKTLKEEFPDVSLILAKDKFIVWIRETKPHSGDCRDCEACQERKKVIKERANQLLEKTGLHKKYEFDVVPILEPRLKSKEELERIRKFFEELRATRRRD